MKRVALVGAARAPGGQRWEASMGDLALTAAHDLLALAEPDAVFAAVPAAPLAEGQSHAGAVLADRLLPGRALPVYQVDAGDASGAAALHAAYAHVRAGLARAVLVLGVAKVSDLPERDRGQLLDSLVDREAEGGLGLGYVALAGLLADLYLQRTRATPRVFALLVARNAAHALRGEEAHWSHAPSVEELRRDLPLAAPLVRSDVAPLVDGAAAVLVAELEVAQRLVPAPVEVLAIGAAAAHTVVADRPDPLRLEAAVHAVAAAVGEPALGTREVAFLETANPCSLLELLAVESLGLLAGGEAERRLAEGFGGIGAPLPINPSGGVLGTGHAFGVSGLEQVREAFLQLTGAAGGRQLEAARHDGARGLCLSLAGFGSLAYATLLGRAR